MKDRSGRPVRLLLLAALPLLLAGCASREPVVQTVVVERTVVSVVRETVEVTRQVEVTREVEVTRQVDKVVTATPSPTPLPSPTAEPVAVPPPGWERFEGGGVELWLPESFEGGDPSKDVEAIAANVRLLGPDFEPMAQMIEQNPEMYLIWAYDSAVDPGGNLTNVTVGTQKVIAAITVETYLDLVQGQLPAGFTVVGREPVTLAGYEAGRVLVEFSLAGTAVKEVLYVLKKGSVVWVVNYATGTDEFEARLPDFERSIATFRDLP